MSQHLFTQDKYSVTAGWDRPLQYFFMVVESENDGDEPMYSNLNDPQAGIQTQSVEHYKAVLHSLGIDSPVGFWEAVERDGENDVGNQLTDWDNRSFENHVA